MEDYTSPFRLQDMMISEIQWLGQIHITKWAKTKKRLKKGFLYWKPFFIFVLWGISGIFWKWNYLVFVPIWANALIFLYPVFVCGLFISLFLHLAHPLFFILFWHFGSTLSTIFYRLSEIHLSGFSDSEEFHPWKPYITSMIYFWLRDSFYAGQHSVYYLYSLILVQSYC